jgi:tripartite-type tricarboxylate transporter receptor subunit TctC
MPSRSRRRLRRAAAATCAVAAFALAPHAAAQAPAYPARPVTLYVGFTAGSATDAAARTMAALLADSFGQQFVIVNRDGAAGVTAANTVARAKPDGYSLIWATSSALAVAPAYGRNVPYNPATDFAPVSTYLYNPFLIATHPSVPAKNLQELIALAKARPGKLSYGSSGVGGGLHMSMELLLHMSGTRMLHVPYRGTPGMMVDLVAGQIDLVSTSTSSAEALIQGGRLRAIAVTGGQRSSRLPEVPTVAEAALPGYEMTGWYALLAPAGTPADIIALLHRHFVRAMEHPSVKANIAQEGALAGGISPEQFSAFIRSELAKFSRLVRDARIAPET